MANEELGLLVGSRDASPPPSLSTLEEPLDVYLAVCPPVCLGPVCPPPFDHGQMVNISQPAPGRQPASQPASQPAGLEPIYSVKFPCRRAVVVPLDQDGITLAKIVQGLTLW